MSTWSAALPSGMGPRSCGPDRPARLVPLTFPPENRDAIRTKSMSAVGVLDQHKVDNVEPGSGHSSTTIRPPSAASRRMSRRRGSTGTTAGVSHPAPRSSNVAIMTTPLTSNVTAV
jgi:hypothetical protein